MLLKILPMFFRGAQLKFRTGIFYCKMARISIGKHAVIDLLDRDHPLTKGHTPHTPPICRSLIGEQRARRFAQSNILQMDMNDVFF